MSTLICLHIFNIKVNGLILYVHQRMKSTRHEILFKLIPIRIFLVDLRVSDVTNSLSIIMHDHYITYYSSLTFYFWKFKKVISSINKRRVETEDKTLKQFDHNLFTLHHWSDCTNTWMAINFPFKHEIDERYEYFKIVSRTIKIFLIVFK